MRLAPLVAVAAALGLAPGSAAACSKADFRVVIDVGHTALAPGATSARGATEFSFNLRLTAVIARKLAEAGYAKVVRMVTTGGAATLTKRAARANALHADLFLSVHHDSAQPQYLESWTVDGAPQLYSDRFKGWSLFVSMRNANAPASLRFATLLADRLLARGLPFSRHHAEPIPHESKPFLDPQRGIYRYDGLVVLAETRAPAVLMESGVIINRDEELAMASPERQTAIADAVVGAVDAFCSDR